MLWWRKKEKPLKQQLIEAKANLLRELQILDGGGSLYPPPDNRSIAATLQAELREIEEALANLGPDDS